MRNNNSLAEFGEETKKDDYVTPFTACWIMLLLHCGVVIIGRSDYRGWSDYMGSDYGGSTVHSSHLGSSELWIFLINFWTKWEPLYPTRSSSSPAGLYTCEIKFLDQEKDSNTPCWPRNLTSPMACGLDQLWTRHVWTTAPMFFFFICHNGLSLTVFNNVNTCVTIVENSFAQNLFNCGISSNESFATNLCH